MVERIIDFWGKSAEFPRILLEFERNPSKFGMTGDSELGSGKVKIALKKGFGNFLIYQASLRYLQYFIKLYHFYFTIRNEISS